MKTIEELSGNLPRQKDLLIEYLHKVQDEYDCIPHRYLGDIAKILKISVSEVFETASFYHHFKILKSNEEPHKKIIVQVCTSLPCQMNKSNDILEKLQNQDNIKIISTACVGNCHNAPVAMVGQNELSKTSYDDILNVVNKKDIDYKHINDYIDHEEYIKNGGYKNALDVANSNNKQKEALEMVKESGLKGMGGAGFPVGIKWEAVLKEKSPRLMMVNIDESEIGTYKDRYYLEKDPHQFLEGMLIASSVVGAEEIYVYLRNEYPSAREILEIEVEKLRKNPPYKIPKIHLRRGAGAYICGEESAMAESIEGKRGMPRLKPPRMNEVGLFGFPTLVQNLESLYWVSKIVENGVSWYKEQGKDDFCGPRTFSISGRVKNPGIHTAPAGVSMDELIKDHCGGMLDGHTFKAYALGGSSGGILPSHMGNIPLDFGTLNDYGCFVGSMAIIVLSDKDNIKDAAISLLSFLKDESCGQCTPCRVGSDKVIQMLNTETLDEELIEDLCQVISDSSICGLGQSIPNPIRCLIKYFPEEI